MAFEKKRTLPPPPGHQPSKNMLWGQITLFFFRGESLVISSPQQNLKRSLKVSEGIFLNSETAPFQCIGCFSLRPGCQRSCLCPHQTLGIGISTSIRRPPCSIYTNRLGLSEVSHETSGTTDSRLKKEIAPQQRDLNFFLVFRCCQLVPWPH